MTQPGDWLDGVRLKPFGPDDRPFLLAGCHGLPEPGREMAGSLALNDLISYLKWFFGLPDIARGQRGRCYVMFAAVPWSNEAFGPWTGIRHDPTHFTVYFQNPKDQSVLTFADTPGGPPDPRRPPA